MLINSREAFEKLNNEANHEAVFSTLVEEVEKWNEERGLTEPKNIALTNEVFMLSEELWELAEASKKLLSEPTISNLCHACCELADCFFVSIGSLRKLREIMSDSKHIVEFYDTVKGSTSILDWYESIIADQANKKGFNHKSLIVLAFDCVTEANKLKGTKRDHNGKIIEKDKILVKAPILMERKLREWGYIGD
jgi:hypothetical protein